jgi:hypothetical protein
MWLHVVHVVGFMSRITPLDTMGVWFGHMSDINTGLAMAVGHTFDKCFV